MLLVITLSFLLIGVFDFLFTKNKKGRWYFIHSVFNFVAIYDAFDEFWFVVVDPLGDFPNKNIKGISMILALHLYHAAFFKLKTMDWVHHIIMMSLIIVPFLMPKSITLTNCFIFFTSGLPGGIDYMLMALVKRGDILSITEKKINTEINVWLRSPGILYCCVVVYIRYLYRDHEQKIITFITILIMIWNSQYFMKIVVYAYGKRMAGSRRK